MFLLKISDFNSFPVYLVLVILIAIQRLFEIKRSRKNEAKLKARGGMELSSGHFTYMRLLHIFWLWACILEAYLRQTPPLWYISLGAFAALLLGQIFRLAAIHTLKERWTVRIIVLEGEAPVTTGIYRYLRHPNYLGVIIEIAALPLIFGCWWTASVFSVLNGIILYTRIGAEEKALSSTSNYEERFEDKKRFFLF